MANITVSCIQKSCSEARATSYSEIRLAALVTDPAAFGSSYSREAAFSLSTWIQRLSERGNNTFYAHLDNNSNTLNPAFPRETAEQWIGIITLLSPAFIISHPNHPPYPVEVSIAEDEGAAVWMLAGMWIRPEWRGKGVGKLLVQAGIDEVRNTSNDPAFAKASRNSKSGLVEVLIDILQRSKEDAEVEDADADRIILLLVGADNAPAVKLYSSVGFKSFQDDTAKIRESVEAMFGSKHGGRLTPAPSPSSKGSKWMEYTVARKRHPGETK